MGFDFNKDLTSEEIIKARYFYNDTKIRYDIIGKDLIKCMTLVTILDNDEIMYYEGGIYNYHGDKKVREVLVKKMGKYLKKNSVEEVIAQIRGLSYINRNRMNTSKEYIHLNNGMYNIITNKFENFRPEVMSTNKIPVDYNPKAECPAIKKFLTEILSEGDVSVVQELIGYVLFKGYPFQLAFMFVGNGANGKSVLINLFKSFIGTDNISNKSLQELGYDKFSSSKLYGKMANLYPDLSDKGLKSTGTFKALVGGDTIDAQRKFQDSFSFENHAKLIFSCNKLPFSTDDTDAFFRRWVIIDFPNTFTGSMADKFLIDKLTTKDELSGLFNIAARELSNILDNDGFSKSQSTEKTKDRYIRMSNSLASFVMDRIETGDAVDDYITKEKFFDKYKDYCDIEQLECKTKQIVGSEVQSLVRATVGRKGPKKDRKPSWVGIKFKDIDDDDDDDDDNKNYDPKPPTQKKLGEPKSEMMQLDRIKVIADILKENLDGLSKDELTDEIGNKLT